LRDGTRAADAPNRTAVRWMEVELCVVDACVREYRSVARGVAASEVTGVTSGGGV
jgi:hypothetical protein